MSYKLTKQAIDKLDLPVPRKDMFYKVEISTYQVSTSLYRRIFGVFKKRVSTINVRLGTAYSTDPETIKRAVIQGATSAKQNYMRTRGLEKTQLGIRNGDLF